MRAALGIALALVPLATGCMNIPCRKVSDAVPWVSVRYQTTDTVGLSQEIQFFEDGMIRLEGANWKSYCSPVSSTSRFKLVSLVEEDELSARLERFGENPRYPQCPVSEQVTITIGAKRATARIDALEGELLSLTELLEEASREQFGEDHLISLVARATRPTC
jgi:hypothetical protein